MRELSPGRLLLLPSGLWLVDHFQPVAAVVDPSSGEVTRLVSWSELPPDSAADPWPGRQVGADTSCLWVQESATGLLARVGIGGVLATARTHGLMLAACGPDVAWCAPPPPDQETVKGKKAAPTGRLKRGRLLRVDNRGQGVEVRTEFPVRSVHSSRQALLVQVDVDPWQLEPLGAGFYEVIRSTRWLSLPWDAPLPDALTLSTHGLPPGTEPELRSGGGVQEQTFWWHDPDEEQEAVWGSGRRWHLGWVSMAGPGRSVDARPVVATVHNTTGETLRRWDLGEGTVADAVPVGDRLAVAISRERDRRDWVTRPFDVVTLQPDRAGFDVLVNRPSVDISEGCWPLIPRPQNIESHIEEVRSANDHLDSFWQDHTGAMSPLVAGLSGTVTRAVGEWPRTRLEWTFADSSHPGLLLRRSVSLFDELGRPVDIADAATELMEDLETQDIPPAAAARDGILDV